MRGSVCTRCLLGGDGELELIDEIGRGGMGTVWRARDPRLDRIVAVKFLTDELCARPGFAERFLREARHMARLQHPRIVTVHDVGELEGIPYFAMEHVDGASLAALRPLARERAIEIVLEVCDALAFAHANGIVHRDIKPENILVDGLGHAKVADFGIAQREGDARLTAVGGVVGTPAYLAPEVLRGATADPRADVYAIAVVLQEVVTPTDVSGPFGAVIGRAMRPLETRTPSIGAFADELRSLRGASNFDDEERLLRHGAAALLTVATAAALSAILVSVTPQVIAKNDIRPLVMVDPEPLADGRVISWARFEAFPVLAALVAGALGALVWALLVRHWRARSLLETNGAPIRQSRALLAAGGTAVIVAVLRRVVPLPALAPYLPIFGGLIEVGCLWLFWDGILEARRVGQSLSKEPLLFLGMTLAVIPPAWELVLWLRAWTP
jgi:eukaryotic-like serine/threonine-protein kinase